MTRPEVDALEALEAERAARAEVTQERDHLKEWAITTYADLCRQISDMKPKAEYWERAGQAMVKAEAENKRLRAVVEDASHAYEQLQAMYDGQDAERKARGEIGSHHRDSFECWLDHLVGDAKIALSPANGETAGEDHGAVCRERGHHEEYMRSNGSVFCRQCGSELKTAGIIYGASPALPREAAAAAENERLRAALETAERERHEAPSVAPVPVLDSVERILDEHSAWIARPSKQVSRAIAMAATIAALDIMRQARRETAGEASGLNDPYGVGLFEPGGLYGPGKERT